MRKFIIFLVVVLFTAGIAACDNNSPREGDGSSQAVVSENKGTGNNGNTSDAENGNSSDIGGREAAYYPNPMEGFKSAHNEVFSFWFDLPESWKAVDKSENGDGYYIISDSSDMDIRVYGQARESSDEEYFQKLSGKNGKIEEFTFNDGIKGKRIENTNSRVYYIRVDNDTYICFYVNYSKNPEWFRSNDDILNKVAMSLRTRMEGPKLGDGVNKISLEDLQLGEVYISMPYQNVKTLMETKLESETKDELGATILFYGDGTEIYIIEDAVYTMNVNTGGYETPRGLKVGDDKARVRELYGEPDNVQDDTHWGYTYDGYELFSVIFEDDKVAQLQIDMVR